MTIPGGIPFPPVGVDGYTIDNAVLFDGSSGYLSYTPGSAGDRTEWTRSYWIKRVVLGANPDTVMVAGADANNRQEALFVTSGNTDRFFAGFRTGGSWDAEIHSNAVYRDTAAWMHIVESYDGDNATAADRYKIWINGEEQDITYTSGTDIGTPSHAWSNNVAHNIGRNTVFTSQYGELYLAEVYLINGLSIQNGDFAVTDFGESLNGIWVPIKYSGSYGTDAGACAYLDFSNAANLGEDSSGNSNNWTVNGTITQVIDVPTNSDSAGNLCVLNSLSNSITLGNNATLSNGNKTCAWSAANRGTIGGTIFQDTGKWVYEAVVDDNAAIGVGLVREDGSSDYWDNWVRYAQNGTIDKYGISFSTGNSALSNNDVVRVEYDGDAGTCAFYVNGTLEDTVTGLSADLHSPGAACASNGASGGLTFRFDADDFTGTPTTGYKAWSTENLPQTFETSGSYTGNGSTDGTFVPLGGSVLTFTVDATTTYTKSSGSSVVDFLSNGIKFRSTTDNVGSTGYTFTATLDTYQADNNRAESN